METKAKTEIETFKRFFFSANGYRPSETQQYHFLSLNDYDQKLVINTLQTESQKNDLAIAGRTNMTWQ